MTLETTAEIGALHRSIFYYYHLINKEHENEAEYERHPDDVWDRVVMVRLLLIVLTVVGGTLLYRQRSE